MPEPDEWHQPGGTISSAGAHQGAAIASDGSNWPAVRAQVIASATTAGHGHADRQQ